MSSEWAGLIRPATRQDMPRVVEMVAALAAHHGEVALLTEEQLIEATGGGLRVLVAQEQGGSLAGYAALFPVMRLQFGERGFDLHHLFTCTDRRGAGVGTALVKASVELAARSGCRFIQVGAHEENHRAHQFYVSAGFTRSRRIPARFSIDLSRVTSDKPTVRP